MISRHWRGLAKTAQAEAYVAHLRGETIPTLSAIPGFGSASILRRALPRGVEFLIITQWLSLDSIRSFAGENFEIAVVPEIVKGMMLEYDETVRHYEVCNT